MLLITLILIILHTNGCYISPWCFVAIGVYLMWSAVQEILRRAEEGSEND